MADKKITVCDRCGKELSYAVFPVLTGRIDSAVKTGFGAYDYSREAFDLCRACTKAFKQFMKGGDDNAAD